MFIREVEDLVSRAQDLLKKQRKDEAKALLVKAVRIIEAESEGKEGFERFKLHMLLNKINTMIKEIDSL